MVSSPCPESLPASLSNSFVSSFNFELSTSKCLLLSRCFRILLNSSLPEAQQKVHFFSLFCSPQKPIPRLFKQFHALAAKHPGWHTPQPLPFAARNKTAKQQVVTPFRPTLASLLERVENTATLSRVFATLTHFVTHNPCVCHSYKKTPGVAYTAHHSPGAPPESLSECGGRSPLFLQATGTPRAERALRNHPTHRGTCITNHHGTRITEHGPRGTASGHQPPPASPSRPAIAIDLRLLGVILM
jgi:hypothetical protein